MTPGSDISLLGVTYQKTAVLILTAGRTSNLTPQFTSDIFPSTESILLMTGSTTYVTSRCLKPGFVLHVIHVSFISLSFGQITWTRHNWWLPLNGVIDHQEMAFSSVFRLQAYI
jgi:hypothetical protein